MVQSCVAYGCTERYSKGCEVGFFRFPINENRRKFWVRAMKRENWEPSSSSRICGKHLQTGKPHLNPEHPDFVPTVFSFSKPITSVKSFERRKECRKKMHGTNLLTTATKPKVSAAACEPEEENFEEISDNVQLTPAETEIAKLKKLNAQMSLEVTALRIERDLWKGKAKLYSEEILSSNEKLLFYTTLESAVFNWIISIIRADIEEQIIIVPIETQLLIILIKLKLNLRSEDLAYRFQVSRRTIARIFDLWIPLLASRLSSLIRWPDKSSFRKHLPSCFKNSIFHDTKAIIDCTEVFVQKAGNQTARSHTWSNYKHHHTIKFLVAVTPNGHISFVSKVFGGRASDKEITEWLSGDFRAWRCCLG